MKFLHTSDLHLGKRLINKSRIDEQREVLEEIANLCESEKVDVLIVAGDVFDNFVPTSEAEQLFFDFLKQTASPSRAVVVISGNHDDWQRLSASHYLAGKLNAYIFGGENVPPASGDIVKCVEAGNNYLKIKKDKESVYVGVLPYPGEARLNEKKSELSYGERIKEWVKDCFKNNQDNLPAILCTHLFMLGGEKSESERDIELGGTRIVEPSVLGNNILYTALGHLHKRQVVASSKNALYSGSILQYAFDEVGHEKSVTCFEIVNNSVQNLQIIPLKGGKKLVKLIAEGVESGKQLLNKYPDCHVHLTLVLKEVLSEAESKELISDYPQLTELDLKLNGIYGGVEGEERKKLDDKQLFEEYYKTKTGESVPEEVLEIYLKALSEEKL